VGKGGLGGGGGGVCGLDVFGSICGKMACSCEYDIEPSGSIKGDKFLD